MRAVVILFSWVVCFSSIVSAATDWERRITTEADAETAASFFGRLAEEHGFEVVFDQKFNRKATLSMRFDHVPLHLAMGYATRATHNFFVEQEPGVNAREDG